MASTTIAPTRMMLKQLKGRLKTARRGHKLMKDKRDELMRQFLDVVKLNKQLRERVERGLTEAFASLQVASAIMSPEMLEQALLYPRQSVELGMEFKNIMSVNVPQYSFKTKNNDPSEIYPYGFAQTSGELDDALSQMAKDLKPASPKPQQNENPKYAMRTWLLRLGFIGDEFKTAREVLTRRLSGNAAFRMAG